MRERNTCSAFMLWQVIKGNCATADAERWPDITDKQIQAEDSKLPYLQFLLPYLCLWISQFISECKWWTVTYSISSFASIVNPAAVDTMALVAACSLTWAALGSRCEGEGHGKGATATSSPSHVLQQMELTPPAANNSHHCSSGRPWWKLSVRYLLERIKQWPKDCTGVFL